MHSLVPRKCQEKILAREAGRVTAQESSPTGRTGMDSLSSALPASVVQAFHQPPAKVTATTSPLTAG